MLNALKYRLLGTFSGTTFPEIVRTADIFGNGSTPTGGYCKVWYSRYGNTSDLLGLANGANYAITIDNRQPVGQGGADYILFGRGGSYYGFSSDTLVFSLDTSGTNDTTFSAGLTLDADPNFVRIWNCIIGVEQSVSHTISYSASGVDVESRFNTPNEPIDVYRIFATIRFPFQYCTE